MSLTGMPLIAVAALCAAGSLAATVVIWNRVRLLRFPLRVVGVLLTETLVVLTVGLVVNRSQQFYPTWAALLRTGNTPGTTYAVAPGHLDQWLLARAGTQRGQSLAFTWQPAGWAKWHLAAAPVVVTPADYLNHPTWRYSAVLALDAGARPWAATSETAAARDAGSSVVVFVDAGPATTAPDLTEALPSALGSSLRVTARRWAMVSSAPASVLARRAVDAAPTRYAALALVTAPGEPPRPAAHPATEHPAVKRPTVKRPTVKRPTVKRPTVKRPVSGRATPRRPVAVALTAAGRPVHLAGGLASALSWAAEQTPSPLAASTPGVTYVPLQHHNKRHGGPHPYPTRRPPVDATPSARVSALAGGADVSGQPRP